MSDNVSPKNLAKIISAEEIFFLKGRERLKRVWSYVKSITSENCHVLFEPSEKPILEEGLPLLHFRCKRACLKVSSIASCLGMSCPQL